MFGLHPAMAPLGWLYQSGELAAVHAVGMARPNRSHVLAMEEIEDADPSSSVRRGWVNRMIGLDADAHAVKAVHLGSGITPTLLVGDAPRSPRRTSTRVALTGSSSGWAHAPPPPHRPTQRCGPPP